MTRGRQMLRSVCKVRKLQGADAHQARVARDTLRLSCAGARIMGGITSHYEAVAVLHRLTGIVAGLPDGCTCERSAETGSEYGAAALTCSGSCATLR